MIICLLFSNLWTISIFLVYILWGQFLPRPSVALVVIFGLESLTLEGKHSSCYLIRHEPIVEEYHWFGSFYCGDNFCLDQVLHL